MGARAAMVITCDSVGCDQRVARSRALRAVLLTHGGDRARISGALAGVTVDQPRLF